MAGTPSPASATGHPWLAGRLLPLPATMCPGHPLPGWGGRPKKGESSSYVQPRQEKEKGQHPSTVWYLLCFPGVTCPHQKQRQTQTTGQSNEALKMYTGLLVTSKVTAGKVSSKMQNRQTRPHRTSTAKQNWKHLITNLYRKSNLKGLIPHHEHRKMRWIRAEKIHIFNIFACYLSWKLLKAFWI